MGRLTAGLRAAWAAWRWDGVPVDLVQRAEAACAGAEAAHKRSLQCALAAGEAAEVARSRGVGDGGGWGIDPDLDTLDAHRGPL
jgi:hypothetical protein